MSSRALESSPPRLRAATTVGGVGSLFGAAFVVGTFPIFTRVVAPMFGATSQTLTRCALAAGVLAAVNVARGKTFRLARRDLARMVALGALTLALGVLLAVAVAAMKASVAIALLFGASIVTAWVAGLILREQVTLTKLAGIMVALAGLATYAHDLAGSWTGVAAAITAGICDGSCNTLRKQVRHVDRGVAVTYQYAIGAALALPVLLWSGEPLIKSAGAWPIVAMIAYAAASIGLGSLLYYGFSRVDVSVGAVIMASQICFTALLGILVLSEIPNRLELTGALLVFTGSTLSVADPRRIYGLVRHGWHRRHPGLEAATQPHRSR